MPPQIELTNPVLANTLGHTAGVLVYAIFILYFVRDRRVREHGGALPLAASGLALVWNLGSLIALGLGASPSTPYVLEASYSALSLLPAVLLHAFLEGRFPLLGVAGYAVSGVAGAMHATELFAPAPQRHDAALIIITAGFGALAPLAAFLASRSRRMAAGGPRLLGTMYLILLAISFVHFGAYHEHRAWPVEVVVHHIGVPLALLMLLQSIRFLLLDAFLVVLLNGAVAAIFTYALFAAERNLGLLRGAFNPGFGQALPVIGTSLILITFAITLRGFRAMLDRVLFGRADLPEAISKLDAAAAGTKDEESFLASAVPVAAAFTGTERFAYDAASSGSGRLDLDAPLPVSDLPEHVGRNYPWAEVAAPLSFSRGDARLVLFGARAGGRRYLSGDLAALARLCSAIVGHVDRIREHELKRLAAEAELRALESQINPHFLFNALNAVYAAIPRSAENAREAVLSLSEMLRYSLRPDTGLVPVAREMEIVRAYLRLESLRLGPRLSIQIHMDEGVASAQVPALSVQPLVENAVKHGVAKKEGPGSVAISVKRLDNAIRIEVSDTGAGFEPARGGGGMGLDNVRQRLRLYFGSKGELSIRSSGQGSCVGFDAPIGGDIPAAATQTA